MGNRASTKAKTYQHGKRKHFLAPKVMACSVSSKVADPRLGEQYGFIPSWDDVVGTNKKENK